MFCNPWFCTLVSVLLSNGAPLPHFIGMLWKRQFTIFLSLTTCVLWLASLVREPKGYIQKLAGLQIRFPCPDPVGEEALKLVNFFVVLTQNNLYPKFPGKQSHLLCSPNYWLCLPFSTLKYWMAELILDVFASSFCWTGPKDSFHSQWDYVSALLPGKEGEGRSRLLSISWTGSLIGRGQELPSALVMS